MFLILYHGSDQSIFKITVKTMNTILAKGVLVLCLIHPLLSIVVLNVVWVMCLHEAMHLGMYRKHHDCIDGYISWSDFSLRTHFVREEIPLGSILLPMILGPIGVFCLMMMKNVLTINPFVIILLRFLCYPWCFNLINLWWFSPDMKCLRKHIKNL